MVSRWWVVLALGLLLAACSKGKNGDPKAGGAAGRPGAGGPVAVKIATLTPQPVEDSAEYLASLTSRHSVTLNPQVTGEVTRIDVQPGQRVKKGDKLIEIDPSREQATLQNLIAQRATLDSQLQLAKQNFARSQQLVNAGVVSRQEFETARSALASAQANVKAADAQIEAQRTQVGYHVLNAPFDGTVGDIPVKMGDLVSPNTKLTTLDEAATLQAYVSLPIERANALQPDSVIQLLDESGKVIAQQKVGFIAPQADPATQSVLLRIDFPPQGEQLLPSQLVRAKVIFKTAPGLLLPTSGVKRQAGQTFAFKAEQGPNGLVARQVPVQLGNIQGDAYVVTSGLKAGDRVVISGLQKLAEGAPIAPEPERVGRTPPPGSAPTPRPAGR